MQSFDIVLINTIGFNLNLSPDQESCGECQFCQQAAAGSCLDIIEIDGASHRGLEDIREIKENTLYATSSAAYKIYIIDEVHMLTKEAFNALLKLLEEPPKRVLFFFATTEPHKILSTILSRCQRFDLKRISEQDIFQKINTIASTLSRSIDSAAVWRIAALADGSLRDAESLFEQLACFGQGQLTLSSLEELLGLLPQTLFFRLSEAVAKSRLEEAFALTDQVFASGKELSNFFEQLLLYFSTLLRIKLGYNPHIYNQEELAQYQKQAGYFSTEQCLQLLDTLFLWQKGLNRISMKKVHLEMLFLELIRQPGQVSVSTILNKLAAMQESPAVFELKKDIEIPSTEPLLNENIPFTKKLSEEKKSPPLTAPAQKTELPKKPKSHYDTLIQFAAVELDGKIDLKRN